MGSASVALVVVAAAKESLYVNPAIAPCPVACMLYALAFFIGHVNVKYAVFNEAGAGTTDPAAQAPS